MIKVFHLRQDVTRDTRLAITDPMVENWPEAMKDGTLRAKETALRVSCAITAFARGCYEQVATYDGDDLSDAFERTNSIDSPWFTATKNGISAEPGRHRSTSVGDIFEDDEGGRFVVDGVGFAPLAEAA